METFFGVDYYPEHWPRERWETDIKLMREMGVDVVRMAEFSWSKLEPAAGEFCFGWLDEIIEMLGAQGIKSILGTPTAAPPAWIIQQTPEIQPVDHLGRQRHFGGRHHDCQSNPVYREHIRRYVTAFAAHFAGNPHVIGWQVDNELGNSHADLCLCPSCEGRFQKWLEEKYGAIETLNEKWGNVFWSQGYGSFSQIQAPKLTASGQNPSALLDWKRFCSDLVLEFHDFQAGILRVAAPDKFITHNMMGFSDKVSYFDLAQGLEFASHDQYPGGHFHAQQNISRADALAAELDFIRGVKKKPFWIMEQQSAITGWEVLGRAPKPGQLGMWAMQSVAHGADAIVFFRWRTCTVGTEQYWHGVLPHSGIPGRSYAELKDFVQKARPLMKEIQGAMPKAKVAIVFSYEQEYAFAIQPHHPDFTYVQYLMTFYKALFEENIPVDFISDKESLDGYDVVIAPLQYLMRPALEEKYRGYVQGGGHLVLTMRTGVKDETNLCMASAKLPGALHDVVGLEVEEYDCLRDVDGSIAWDGQRFACEKWCDIITLRGAQALASYDFEFYAGSPAITVNGYGGGKAYYVGTQLGTDAARRFVQTLCQAAGLEGLAQTPQDVEVVHRCGSDGRTYYFVMNHTGQEQSPALPEGWQPFAGETGKAGGGKMPPYSWAVYTD